MSKSEIEFVPVSQAAEALGITRQRVHQILKAHPEIQVHRVTPSFFLADVNALRAIRGEVSKGVGNEH
jgi:hypothetical protein